MMKRMLAIFGPLCVAGALGACGGGDVVEPKLPEALTGSWVANSTCSPSCSFTLTSVANPSASNDIVATSGITVDLLLRADGSAVLAFFGLTETGTVSVAGNTMYLTSGGVVDTIDYTVSPTTLDLKFRSRFEFDLNQDGVLDPALGHAVLKKK
jgi:hypothetical protein